MSSTSTASAVRDRVATQRNVTILAAILVALPTSYVFRSTVGGTSADFLLLFTLAVGVPTAYDDYWPQYDRTWKAVAWVVVACAVAAVEFVGLYLAGTRAVGLSPFLAGVGAFLVTHLGTFAWLSLRRRR